MRILLLSILLSISIWTTGQSFHISCDSTRLETGEQAHIKLIYKGKGNVIWRNNSNENDTLSGAIEVINYSKIDTLEEGNSIVYTQTLFVTAWDSGYHVVPPIYIIVDGKEMFSNPLLLHYSFPNVNQQAPIKGIKDQIDTPFVFAEIAIMVYWLIGGFVFLCCIIAIILYISSKKEKPEKVVYKKPIIDLLTERYIILKSEKTWLNNKEKAFHSELSNILNEYLEYRYRIKSIESTSNETIQQLKSLGINNSIILDVEHILNFSDMIKFAKQKGIESQHEQALEVLYSFLKRDKKVD
jgi:hypothetical protein